MEEGGRTVPQAVISSQRGTNARPSATETEGFIKATISCPQRQIDAPQAPPPPSAAVLFCCEFSPFFPRERFHFNSLLIRIPASLIHQQDLKRWCYFHC